MKCAPGKWIPCALENHKPGSLHRQLHVPKGTKIPLPLLRRAKTAAIGKKIRAYDGKWITVTLLLKRRVNLAKTLRSF